MTSASRRQEIRVPVLASAPSPDSGDFPVCPPPRPPVLCETRGGDSTTSVSPAPAPEVLSAGGRGLGAETALRPRSHPRLAGSLRTLLRRAPHTQERRPGRGLSLRPSGLCALSRSLQRSTRAVSTPPGTLRFQCLVTSQPPEATLSQVDRRRHLTQDQPLCLTSVFTFFSEPRASQIPPRGPFSSGTYGLRPCPLPEIHGNTVTRSPSSALTSAFLTLPSGARLFIVAAVGGRCGGCSPDRMDLELQTGGAALAFA